MDVSQRKKVSSLEINEASIEHPDGYLGYLAGQGSLATSVHTTDKHPWRKRNAGLNSCNSQPKIAIQTENNTAASDHVLTSGLFFICHFRRRQICATKHAVEGKGIY
jgi:predicted nicotinamide N-methyase